MKQYKKFIAFMLGTIITMSNVDVIRAEKIENDINGHWGQQSIERWIKAGIIQGDGTNFYPNNNITRAEMAVIISNLLVLKEQAQNNFVDLEDKWYTEAILKCNAAGIMLGDGEKVRPNDPITRQEAAVLIGKMLALKESQEEIEQFEDSEEVAGWAQGFITAMSELGILTGYDGEIHPSDNISRASVMTMLDRAIGGYITEPGTYEIDTKGIVIIAAPDVILEDSTANSVIILPAVEHGEMVIKNSTVKEDIIVSGDVDTLKLMGSTAQEIIIENKVEQLTFEGKTSVSTLTVNEGAKGLSVGITSDALVEDVMLKADDVTIESKGSISNILVDGNNAVLNTINTKVTIDEESSNIKVNGASVEAGVIITESKESNKETPSNSNSDNNSNSEESHSISSTYYTVSFDTGVANITINKQSVKKNKKIVQPEVEMIREGYIFEGWYNGLEPWDFTKDVVRGNMTLTAKWKKIVEPLYQVSDISLVGSETICFRMETADGELITKENLWNGESVGSSGEPEGEYIITVNWKGKDGSSASSKAEGCSIVGAEEYLSITNKKGFENDVKKISKITVEKVIKSQLETTEDGESKWHPIIGSKEVLANNAEVKETAVESIELSEKEVAIKVGETKTVTAQVKPILATNQTLTMVSENEKIAQVSDKGEIKGIAPGETTITYKAANGVYAQCKVVVEAEKPEKPEEPEKPEASYQVIDLSYADDKLICFRIKTADGTLITEKKLWKDSGSPSVEPTGEYIITVNWVDKNEKPASLPAIKPYISGAEEYLCVNVEAYGFKDDVKKISDITVDKVSGSDWKEENGTSKWEPIIESTELLAENAELQEMEVESIELSEKEIRIKVGEIKKVIANVQPIVAVDRTITMVSENESIATVSNAFGTKGEIKGVAPGETKIIYKAANGVYAECKVVVESAYQVSDIYLADDYAICFSVKEKDGKQITDKDLWLASAEKTETPKGDYIITVNWIDEYGDESSLEAGECYIAGAEEYLSVTNFFGFEDNKKKISNIIVKKVSGSEWKTENGLSSWHPIIGSTEVLAKNAEVKETAVESIELRHEGVAIKEITLKVGDKETVTAQFQPALATNQRTYKKSGNDNIATVSSLGVIKGEAPGETIITYTAAENGVEATCRVVVEAKASSKEEPEIGSMESSKEEPAVESMEQSKGESEVESMEQSKEESEVESMESSKEEPEVESMEQSKEEPEVESMEQSKEEPEVESMEQSKEEPEVESIESSEEELEVESIELSEQEITIKVGETKKVTAAIKPILATDQAITIVSEDKGIAEVSTTGEIIGIAPGETRIIYQVADGVSAICKVVVEAQENTVESFLEQIENNDLELTLPTEQTKSVEEQLEDSEEVMEKVTD